MVFLFHVKTAMVANGTCRFIGRRKTRHNNFAATWLKTSILKMFYELTRLFPQNVLFLQFISKITFPQLKVVFN